MMAKDEKKTVTVNGQTYNIEDLNEIQINAINHIADLDRKISSAQFNLHQLHVGRESFVSILTKSLENDTTDVAAE